eukprot:COSAG06_NODE_29034_length_563_cov_1.318966_2_plen_74_part_01
MAWKEEKKLIAAEQEKIARKEEEEAVQELEDLDFGALGGGMNWADADESAELIEEPEPEPEPVTESDESEESEE